MEGIKYPEIHVQLSGEDGNAMFILGKISIAMKKAGVSKEERDKFFEEATAGNYDNLLRVCQEWVDCL